MKQPTEYMAVDNRTPAALASGAQKLIGPVLLLMLLAFPAVLFVPLLTTKLYFFVSNDLVLARAAYDLFVLDKFLFLVVFVFGILMPVVKLLLAVLCWYQFPVVQAKRWNETLGVLSKLSMLDVMLLAIAVVAIKGVGVGTVEIRGGIYLYTALVLSSLGISLAMSKAIVRF